MAHRSHQLCRALFSTALLACGSVALAVPAFAQGDTISGSVTPSKSAPHQTGTVKEVHNHDFLLTVGTQDFAVSVPEGSHIFVVTPGVKKLSDAPPGGMKDIQPGDRASVTGTVGDSGIALAATRILVMKGSTVAAVHATESSAWAQGTGGIVKAVSGSDLTVSSGMKTVAVATSGSTVVRRYAPGSVKFEDATTSTVAAIQPGDQIRVRGAKSADGSSVTADEIVTGSFKNYSGVIASIDPAASTVTLKDLATKKTVTVAFTPSSDVRRLPPQMANMLAARMKGGAAGGPGGAGASSTAQTAGTTQNAGVGEAGGQVGRRSGGANFGDQGGQGGPGAGGGRRGGDLSSMLPRMPTETLAGLKPGEAVMIVATSPAGGDMGTATAISMLAGVDALLAAPAGQQMTLSPWSLGGGGGEGEGGGGGQ